jgi:hypothetical protein
VDAKKSPGVCDTRAKAELEQRTARPPSSPAAQKLQRDADRSVADRRPLPRPEPPKPAAPQPAEAVERLGPWKIISRDSTGKRAAAQCTACLTIREIGISGDAIASCGCRGSKRPGPESFAAAAAAAEMIVSRRRHRGAT